MPKQTKSEKKWFKKITDMGYNVRYGCNNSGDPDLVVTLSCGREIGIEIKQSSTSQLCQGYLHRCEKGHLSVAEGTEGKANKEFVQYILDNNKNAITSVENFLHICTYNAETKAYITPKGKKELKGLECTSKTVKDFYYQKGNNFIIFDKEDLIFSLDGVFDSIFEEAGIKVHFFPTNILVKVRIRSKPSWGEYSYHSIVITTQLKNCKDTKEKLAIFQTLKPSQPSQETFLKCNKIIIS